MDRLERLDSQSPAIRSIERWKRGLAALAIVAIIGLVAFIVAGLSMLAIEALGGSEFAQDVTGIAVFGVLAPWLIGQREALRQIGNLAKIAD